MNRRKRPKLSTVCLHCFFLILVVISVYPILLILFNAVSAETHIKEIGYVLYPQDFSLSAFQYLMKDYSQLLKSLWASIVYAVGGSLFSVLVQAMLGYTLTRKEFFLKKTITIMLIITMFFNPGLIPTYMVNTQIYHLENSWLVYILPGSVSAFSVVIYRTYFTSIPDSLIESAEIDGANHMQILRKIIIPLSLPIIVTQFFLNMSGRWKTYTTSLYYITDQSKVVLEYYIQQLMKDASLLAQNATSLGLSPDQYPVETMRFAVVFFTLIPMLLVFPFLQKYFEKGAMVGAVKG